MVAIKCDYNLLILFIRSDFTLFLQLFYLLIFALVININIFIWLGRHLALLYLMLRLVKTFFDERAHVRLCMSLLIQHFIIIITVVGNIHL